MRNRFVFGTQVGASLGDGGGADREWLLTDGTGGYAMGTVSGLRTRRQHALFVTPDRNVALVTLDPVATLTSGARVELAVHEWASGAVAPQGHRLLESFDLTDGVPRWRWRIGDVVIERELAMERGRPGIAAVHRVVAAPGPVRLALGVLCTWRDADGERPGALVTESVADGVLVEGAYRIAGAGWRAGADWYYGAHTRRDGALEDLWFAGTFSAALGAGEALEVCAWTGDLTRRPAPATAVVATARQRARKVVRAAKPADDVEAHLALAADAHVVAGPDVVASYPGRGPVVRDTLIGYEGLFLETGRAGEGRALLRGYADRLRVPAMDVPLWYLHAVERHVTRTGDTDLAAELLPVLDGIIAERLDGTGLYGVRADPVDGLLTQDPEPGTLTWMDARPGRHPVTPRPGKPVEVNALWVNALGAVARLHELLGDEPDTRYDAARTGFLKRYPAPDGWLFDVVDAPPPPYPLAGSLPYDDPVLRPNQLLAWSLPYAPLDATCPEPLGAVGAQLLTPLGPRSLAPTEYGYQGTYRGDADRHQGAAWPWLIGAYAAACRVAELPTTDLLTGLAAQLSEHGLGSVGELADGDPPHAPGGAPFHARSVAELLRARRLLASSGG
jgi:glycogen debranching enzyme